jgi:hypothetical protein
VGGSPSADLIVVRFPHQGYQQLPYSLRRCVSAVATTQFGPHLLGFVSALNKSQLRLSFAECWARRQLYRRANVPTPVVARATSGHTSCC